MTDFDLSADVALHKDSGDLCLLIYLYPLLTDGWSEIPAVEPFAFIIQKGPKENFIASALDLKDFELIGPL
jgi:hypothetical protein